MDPYHLLAIAIIRRAVQDARLGRMDAAYWLVSVGPTWLQVLGSDGRQVHNFIDGLESRYVRR